MTGGHVSLHLICTEHILSTRTLVSLFVINRNTSSNDLTNIFSGVPHSRRRHNRVSSLTITCKSYPIMPGLGFLDEVSKRTIRDH